MPKLFAIILCVLVAACTHFHEASVAKQGAECSAQGGRLISFPDLYPRWQLNYFDKRQFACNIPTTDGGKSCTDRIGQCQSLCLAPSGSAIGQRVTGTCSPNVLVPEGTLLVGGGVVLDPNVLE
jgi:hypothetical protein